MTVFADDRRGHPLFSGNRPLISRKRSIDFTLNFGTNA